MRSGPTASAYGTRAGSCWSSWGRRSTLARGARRGPLAGRIRRPTGAVRRQPAPTAGGERDARGPGHHHEPAGSGASPRRSRSRSRWTTSSTCATTRSASSATSASRRAATDAQNTFAIAVAGRGFDARISTEYAVPLPESACVYCGNCIGVCPTGALMFTSEHDMRAAGTWDESNADRHRHDLPVLRRRLQAGAPRPGQRDREGHLAGGQRRDERASVHQGPIRVPVRAAEEEGPDLRSRQ